MSMKNLLWAAVLAGVASCGPAVPKQTPAVEELAPEFEGGGQAQNIGESVYPGPYGIGIGSVIPNYKFFGFPRANLDSSQLSLIHLSDFYNPSGTEPYPPGSPFGEGTPKPLALLLDRSAVWCSPCVQEASTVIPQRRAQYAPKGEFFVTLDDGPDRGVHATQADLQGWTSRFKINYPAVIDPNATLSAVVGRDAYPGNVIVRTKDMKIIAWTAGAPDAVFWQKFEAVMANQPVLPGE